MTAKGFAPGARRDDEECSFHCEEEQRCEATHAAAPDSRVAGSTRPKLEKTQNGDAQRNEVADIARDHRQLMALRRGSDERVLGRSVGSVVHQFRPGATNSEVWVGENGCGLVRAVPVELSSSIERARRLLMLIALRPNGGAPY